MRQIRWGRMELANWYLIRWPVRIVRWNSIRCWLHQDGAVAAYDHEGD